MDKQKTLNLLNELITNMDKSFNLYFQSIKLYDELNVRISTESISKLSKKMQTLNELTFTCKKVRDYLTLDLMPTEPSQEEKDTVNSLLKEYREAGHPDHYIPQQIKD